MSVVKNSALNFILTISTVLFPFLIIPYITRVLSVGEVGKVMYADAISQYLIILSALGIPFYGVREIAKLKGQIDKISNIVVELVIIQLVISLISCTAFIVASPFLGSVIDNKLIALSCIFVISNSFLIEWFYQGIQDFKYITLRSVIIKVLSLLLVIILVKEKYDGFIYYAILTALTIVNSCLNLGRFLKIGYRKGGEFNFKRHFKPLIVTFGINFSISIYAILDTLILGYFYGQDSVGYYTISLKIVKTFWIVINAFGIVMISHTALLIKENRMDEVAANVNKSLNVILTFSIPFIVICQLFPNEILILIGGSKYLHAAFLLKILSVLPLIIGVCNVYGTQFLMVYNKEKYVFYATLIALVVSITANIILVPYFKEVGTGIASVASEIVVCVIIIYFAFKYLKNQLDMKYIFQIILSSLTLVLYWSIIKIFLSGFLLMFYSLLLFCITFILLQIYYFKSAFINYLIEKVFLLIKK